MTKQKFTNNRYSIYAYTCPITKEIFYIGQDSKYGTRGMAFNEHKHGAVQYKLQKLQNVGINPVITRLLQFETSSNPSDDLNNAEIYWIAEGRRRGWPLLNCTNGGYVTCGWRCHDETRAKISAANTGKKRTPEMLERYRLAHTGKKASEETKRKMSLARAGKLKSDEHKAALSASWSTHHTAESLEKIAASKRGKARDHDTKLKISQKLKGKPWSKARRLAHELLKLKSARVHDA